jgi:hypothetical protein
MRLLFLRSLINFCRDSKCKVVCVSQVSQRPSIATLEYASETSTFVLKHFDDILDGAYLCDKQQDASVPIVGSPTFGMHHSDRVVSILLSLSLSLSLSL